MRLFKFLHLLSKTHIGGFAVELLAIKETARFFRIINRIIKSGVISKRNDFCNSPLSTIDENVCLQANVLFNVPNLSLFARNDVYPYKRSVCLGLNCYIFKIPLLLMLDNAISLTLSFSFVKYFNKIFRY